MKQNIIQIGNSSGIIIPRSILKATKLKAGEELIVEGVPNKQAILLRKNTRVSKDATSITLEFFVFLENINKKYGKALKELAKK